MCFYYFSENLVGVTSCKPIFILNFMRGFFLEARKSCYIAWILDIYRP